MSSGTAIASKSNSGETDNARQYRSLVEAVRLINRSRECWSIEEKTSDLLCHQHGVSSTMPETTC